MRHVSAAILSTLLSFAVSGMLLFLGWRLDTLDLFAGVAFGLVLGFLGASLFLRPGKRAHRRPGPARYALAGGVMGGVNFLGASAAVLAQPFLRQEMADSFWNKAVMAATGGWMVAHAAADPGRILVIAVASISGGLIAGLAYGMALRRRVVTQPA